MMALRLPGPAEIFRESAEYMNPSYPDHGSFTRTSNPAASSASVTSMARALCTPPPVQSTPMW